MSAAWPSGAAAPTRSVTLLGVPIDDVTMPETIDRIVALVAEGRRTQRTHQVATVNVDFLVNANHDPGLLAILRRADLAIPDGMPLVWGARLLGSKLRSRVAGADLPDELAARAAREGLRLYFFGGAAGVGEQAAAILRDRHPGLDVIADAGPQSIDVSEVPGSVISSLADADADVILVALGNPKQERFIAEHGSRIGAPVMIGVGASLDFVTGRQRRAPRWMQRVGLEWLWRAVGDPRRLAARYGRDFVVFGPRFARQWWEIRSPRRGRARSWNIEITRDEVVIAVRPGHGGSDPLEAIDAALAEGAALRIDLGATTGFDIHVASLLFESMRRAEACGAAITVDGGRDGAARALARLGLTVGRSA